MDRNLAATIANLGTVRVEGSFERHVSPTVRTLTGSSAGGRWGPPGAYSVLYLGRPTASVVAEAYRALVDDSEDMTGNLVGPRNLLTCEVAASKILDLRESAHVEAVGLDPAALEGPHPSCQRVGQAAHQLELHGVIAPAATALGETLALFELHLPESELPTLKATTAWHTLPADPRPSGTRGRASKA